jgi:hypothetical protein
MVKPVQRSDILYYQTYEDRRAAIQKEVFDVKAQRRVHAGEFLTFLFENATTVRYQIQEMMRAERLVKETAIQHEIDTYNETLGGPGELGCALLIEIAEAARRKELLTKWRDLPRHLYVKLDDGTKVPATYDPRQVGEDRLSAVQYLKFDTGGRVPVAVGSDLPELRVEAALTPEQQRALAEDLG